MRCCGALQRLEVVGGPVNPEPIDLAGGRRQVLRPVRRASTSARRAADGISAGSRSKPPAAAPARAVADFLHWQCEGETTVVRRWRAVGGARPRTPHVPAARQANDGVSDCSTWQTGIWLRGPGFDRVGRYGLRFDGCELRVRDRWPGIAVATSTCYPVGAGPAARRRPLTHNRLRVCATARVVLAAAAPASCAGSDDACDAFVDGGLRPLREALQRLARACRPRRGSRSPRCAAMRTRSRVAVAGDGHRTQGRTRLRDPAAIDGTLSGDHLRPKPTGALSRGGAPRACLDAPDPEAHQRRALGGDGRLRSRARHQPAQRRGLGALAGSRPAQDRSAARRAEPGLLDARRLWLLGGLPQILRLGGIDAREIDLQVLDRAAKKIIAAASGRTRKRGASSPQP